MALPRAVAPSCPTGLIMYSSSNEVLFDNALAIAVVSCGPILLLLMSNTLRVLVFVISNSAQWSPSLLV